MNPEKKLERRFPIRKSGGKLGWPRFVVVANRVGHSGLNFASIAIDRDDENYISISPEQAERLVEVLPKAIAFARGKSGK